MTPDQWATLGAIGEVAGALFTFVGVLVSLYISIKALREVQTDRRLNKAPYLAFEPGGQRHPLEFKPLTDQEKVKEGVDESENGARVRLQTEKGRITHEYHGLRNYGLGPAIHARITWIPKKIWIGTEVFEIDSKKSSEPKYSRNLNTIPASPGHILPNQEATFFRIPAFIRRDYQRKITRVTGILEIECSDIFKQKHVTRQEFHLFTGYKDNPPFIHFTFADIKFDIPED
jgi:hypothetical protein